MVYGGGIQGVNGLVQLDPEGFVDVGPARLGDQPLGEVGVDSPVAPLVGVGQRAFTLTGHY